VRQALLDAVCTIGGRKREGLYTRHDCPLNLLTTLGARISCKKILKCACVWVCGCGCVGVCVCGVSREMNTQHVTHSVILIWIHFSATSRI